MKQDMGDPSGNPLSPFGPGLASRPGASRFNRAHEALPCMECFCRPQFDEGLCKQCWDEMVERSHG